ncbi:hypothetical protein ACFY9N_00075 [Microbacterium sp. NPDC008134]|uniref:hypothetical protein n=1 Tax=Microbacterium sp. NPDC008134 TaxID=3364183 RepID=UPI0036E3C4F1
MSDDGRAGDTHMPTGADAEERIRELLDQRQRDGVGVDDVPAGHAGADSGSAATVGVDEATDEAAAAENESYNSEHNDEPGIGNRGR